MYTFRNAVFLTALLFSSLTARPQRTFTQLDNANFWILTGAGITLSVGSYWLQHQLPPLAPFDTKNRLITQSLPSYEQPLTKYDDKKAARWSDALLGAAVLLPPALVLSQPRGREKLWHYGVLYAQTGLLTYGITNTIKVLAAKPRPYVYNAAVPASEKWTVESRLSYVSGHTSMVAAMCFGTAYVLQKEGYARKWQPLIWAGAATLPVATAWLRTRAGKHFYHDVARGYVVGALTGMLVPTVYQKLQMGCGFNIQPLFLPQGGGVYVGYQW